MDVKKVDVQITAWDIILNGYDDHVNDWFLMSSPLTPILIMSAYLLFVLKIGPAYMKGKPAYSLKNVLIVHNAAQVLFSTYLVYKGLNIFYNTGFIEKTCAMENKEHAYLVREGSHLYLIAKFAELFDTIFFVLRKKWNQISFLHVYHHTLMFSMCWIVLKYAPSHSFIFLGVLNSFVHIIMYAYGLAAFPSLSKYLWWKKYITKMQLIQFVIIGINCTVNFYSSVCPTSYLLISVVWFNIALFLYLFSKFYLDSYIKNKKIKENFAKENSNATFNLTKYEPVNDHKVTEKIR